MTELLLGGALNEIMVVAGGMVSLLNVDQMAIQSTHGQTTQKGKTTPFDVFVPPDSQGWYTVKIDLLRVSQVDVILLTQHRFDNIYHFTSIVDSTTD
tara:strand:+ start:195 stop:485 length:291 start_codon:yes stop_codon:yes gene_type:complete